MIFREWLYAKLTDPSATELRALVGNRVFAKKSMKSSVEAHPYLVYKLGNDTSEGLSEGRSPHRQFFMIYVHDYRDEENGDYTRVDAVIEELKTLLNEACAPEADLIYINYLETSQDLDDETLNTVFKYIRFQAIIGKAE